MMELVWGIALIAPLVAFCIGLVAMVIMMERDLKIAEKRWYNQQLREQIDGTRSTQN
jgi:hypothetical protein